MRNRRTQTSEPDMSRSSSVGFGGMLQTERGLDDAETTRVRLAGQAREFWPRTRSRRSGPGNKAVLELLSSVTAVRSGKRIESN